jgi:O-antigen ligase
MSVSLGLKPYNAISPGTVLNAGTKPIPLLRNFAAICLFLCAGAATLTIWRTDPLGDRFYECSILSLAGCLLCRSTPISWRFALPLALLGSSGFLQVAAGATVYRYGTLESSLQFAALAATAFVSFRKLSSAPRREIFLKALAWFGFLVSVTGVVAYYTSPGKVLWLFDVQYPDVWGPFLSRNNFAQFLELTLPIALWLAFRQPSRLLYWAMAVSMLTAGLVSASRAGAILLLLEAVAMFWLCGRRRIRWAAAFAITVVLLGALTGADTLIDRLRSPDPFAYRDRIYQSTVEMIAARPWQGYGLGTFAFVYPEFAKFDSGYRIEHAHNDWLEWTAEGGLGFCAIWALLVVPASFRSFHHPWALGIPAIFLHALADFPMARLGVATWAFILLGALEGARSDDRSQGTARSVT